MTRPKSPSPVPGVQMNHHAPPLCGECPSAFTLIELLVVMAIMVTLMLLMIPSVQGLKKGEDVTKSAYDVAGLIESARSYATANNTYVWVGFFEENGQKASTLPATPGTGRIVLSMVAARDGTLPYDPKAPAAISSGTLTQINKLVKIDNMHLKTFSPGDGTSNTFDHRPAVLSGSAQIGDTTPAVSATSFKYPLTGTAVQYTFTKAIQFSPRGEARVNNASYPLTSIVEIGLQPTRGGDANAASPNLTAIQVTGILGNVKIYRR